MLFDLTCHYRYPVISLPQNIGVSVEFMPLSYLQIRGGIHIIFFLFLKKNICCWYSLEVTH